MSSVVIFVHLTAGHSQVRHFSKQWYKIAAKLAATTHPNPTRVVVKYKTKTAKRNNDLFSFICYFSVAFS